jgi:hypothetical protein
MASLTYPISLVFCSFENTPSITLIVVNGIYILLSICVVKYLIDFAGIIEISKWQFYSNVTKQILSLWDTLSPQLIFSAGK